MASEFDTSIAQARKIFSRFLEYPFIATVRRNHAIEHATVHVLAQRRGQHILAGRASFDGFYIYGPVDTEELAEAARQALERLRAGEKHLAIHPRCGTNLAVTGFLAGLASLWAVGGRGSLWLKLPRVLLAATLATIAAQPLGPAVQEHITTSSEMGQAKILGVARRRSLPGGVIVHQVQVD